MNELIRRALQIATQFGGIDGYHHKTWVIDQMVRALTGCPNDGDGFGENAEYLAWVREHNDGDDGPDTYSWDEGIAP